MLPLARPIATESAHQISPPKRTSGLAPATFNQPSRRAGVIIWRRAPDDGRPCRRHPSVCETLPRSHCGRLGRYRKAHIAISSSRRRNHTNALRTTMNADKVSLSGPKKEPWSGSSPPRLMRLALVTLVVALHVLTTGTRAPRSQASSRPSHAGGARRPSGAIAE